MSNRKIKGLLMLIWAVFFINFQTRYFGNNWFPGSLAELICDFVGFAVCLASVYFIMTKKQIE